MAENSPLINYLFGQGGDAALEKQFDLNRKSRSRRMREIFAIARKRHFMSGFTPEQFRSALEELGPSFVKIGQTLSTRSEILPKAYCDELAKLQADCDPLPFEKIVRALKAIYGGEFDNIFESIDPKPLGSASLAQVHKAVLKNGDVVAVKVQRPGVKYTMAQDIDIMRIMARRASRLMKDDQILDFREVVEEMWKTFLEETDFSREAENLQTFAQLNEKCKFIACPRVYPEYCSEYVLVMEYVEGIPISDPDRLVDAGYDLSEIGEKILDNYATQVLDNGFFHADPHPGNIIIRGGKIVYIDLGIMGRLTSAERAAFGRIINAVGVMDSSALKDALISFGTVKEANSIDHTRFLSDLDSLLQSYGSCDVSDLDVGQFLTDIIALTRTNRCQLPASVTNVSRGIVSIEGTIASFIPDANMIGIINDHIKRTVDPTQKAKETLEEAALSIKRASDGLVEAAEYSGQTLRMLTRGQLKFNMEVLGSDAPMLTLSKIINRMAISIIIAGLFIGSSTLVPYASDPRIAGIPAVSFFGYAGAMALSIWVVVDIWRRH